MFEVTEERRGAKVVARKPRFDRLRQLVEVIRWGDRQGKKGDQMCPKSVWVMPLACQQWRDVSQILPTHWGWQARTKGCSTQEDWTWGATPCLQLLRSSRQRSVPDRFSTSSISQAFFSKESVWRVCDDVKLFQDTCDFSRIEPCYAVHFPLPWRRRKFNWRRKAKPWKAHSHKMNLEMKTNLETHIRLVSGNPTRKNQKSANNNLVSACLHSRNLKDSSEQCASIQLFWGVIEEWKAKFEESQVEAITSESLHDYWHQVTAACTCTTCCGCSLIVPF